MSDPSASAAILTLRLADGRGAALTLKAEATVLTLEEEQVSCYDLSGRPYVLLAADGTTWRRALDGRLLEKRPAMGGEGQLRRLWSAEDAVPIVEAARHEAEAVLRAVTSAPDLADETRAAAVRRLTRIAAMGVTALREDAARYRAAYRPVGILPPDQYLALVLQATEGCSWNACTFCDLYRDVGFRVKGTAEFEAHLEAVRAFFGESIALRRGVFLGDANALCVAQERLVPLFEVVQRELPLAGRGVHSFVDVWTGHRKTAAEYHELARLGLRRVYVGLESGDPELLAWLDKPGSPREAVDLVAGLHEAGLAVGVIVLVGAGGERFGEAHGRATAGVLSAMRLLPGDIVYFSELVEHPGLEYARRAAAEGLRPLAPEALAAQRQAILAALVPADPARPPRASVYDIREFIY